MRFCQPKPQKRGEPERGRRPIHLSASLAVASPSLPSFIDQKRPPLLKLLLFPPHAFIMGNKNNPSPLSLLLLLLLSLVPCPSLSDDSEAMQDIAKSLIVPEWKLPSADPCSWSGVVCNGRSVVEIVLKNKGVSGVLSPSISKLSSLKSLQLQNNQIKGDLPSLANLALLESVFLDNNAFTTIPANFFSGLTSLQTVAVHKNPFKPWSIPDDVSKCENLVEFSASNAGVTGKIPDFFKQVDQLAVIVTRLQHFDRRAPGILQWIQHTVACAQ